MKQTIILDVTNLNHDLLQRAYVMDDPKARQLAEEATDRVHKAACVLADGGLVAFPTETVYGLGANALSEEAVKKVYAAKGRPSDNPMIVHIARASDIGSLTWRLSPELVRLIDNFWPGPLTVVLKKKADVPDVTTGGLDTVAIRIPDDPAALELIARAGVPVAAPSANLSGRPSPTRAEHVVQELSGVVDVILKGGDCRVGIESTVVDLSREEPTILRPGIITADQIEAAIGRKVRMDPAILQNRPRDVSRAEDRNREARDAEDAAAPRAPGMKYRHYAPRAEMLVIEGQKDRVRQEIRRLKQLNEGLGLKVGVLLFEEKAFIEAAHDFFARLRELDAEGVDLILAGALSDQDGVGFAVMNRMMKAAGYNIAKV